MAASDYDFNQTRTEVIERAFRIIGKLSPGETVTAEMHTQAVGALNTMVESWQSENVFLWAIKPFTQTVTSGVSSYSLSATDPLLYGVDKAFIRINNTDIPLEVVSYRQYIDIPVKTSGGDPVLVAVDNQISPTLYVWPVPQQTRSLYLLGLVRLKDFDTSSGNPDFPVRYLKALAFGLASDLAPEYGLAATEQRNLMMIAEKEFLRAKRGERQRPDNNFLKGAF